ncbi:MAG: GNAT family N-acetyltransferase, partial [Thermoprotei archaeon]
GRSFLAHISVRKYGPGDEKSIVEVMDSSFETFKGWGLTPGKWLGYEVDPGFRKENSYVVESDNKIIGHAQVVEKELNYGKFVKVAGIANVCTEPGTREKGMATTLMNEVVNDIAQNYNLSGLDTGYGSSAHRIYRGVGYSPFHFFRSISGETWNVSLALKRLNRIAGKAVDEVRPFRSGGEKDIEETYADNAVIVRSSHKRSHNYWEEKLFKRNFWHTAFYKNFNSDDVLVLPGRGYAYLDLWEDRKGSVREALAKPGDYIALAAIYARALSRFSDSHEVSISAPEGDPRLDYILADFY